jgi:hypothetical protein
MTEDSCAKAAALVDRLEALLDRHQCFCDSLAAELIALLGLIDAEGSPSLKRDVATWVRGLNPRLAMGDRDRVH